MFDRLAETSRKLHPVVRYSLLIMLALYIGYEIYFYTGLWRFFTNVQLKILKGEYYPALSLSLTVLVGLIPVALIQYALIFLKLFPSNEKKRE